MASLMDTEYSGEEVQKFREIMRDWKAFMEFPRQAPRGPCLLSCRAYCLVYVLEHFNQKCNT